ncbi:MAG: hypothetical protein LBH13_09865 [Cellulomonadaceae bacterium]|jgi:hypothetical protein|nr:hypothetical protein [Cellulomonadaceae bacterium]
MLGRISSESHDRAALAAHQAGWSTLVVPDGLDAASDSAHPERVELLDLGSVQALLNTVAQIRDLSAVIDLGHPEHPDPVIESGLLASDSSLVFTDCVFLPGDDDLPGDDADGGARWFGLLQSRDERPRCESTAQVWLAFGPNDDYRGSLREALGVVADAGIDLQHLRSQPEPHGPHHFFTSFFCPSSSVLDALTTELDSRGVAHRTLAVLPGAEFLPHPAAIAPTWGA